MTSVRAFRHDYETKARESVDVRDIAVSDVGGNIYWIDVPDGEEIPEVSGVDPEAVRSLGSDLGTNVFQYSGSLFRFDVAHVLFDEWEEAGELPVRRVRCLLGPRFLMTIHEDPDLVDRLIKGYVTDFQTAKSAVFLVYEMFHHVLDSYVRIHKIMKQRLKSIDKQVVDADEAIIRTSLALHSEFLALRDVAHSSRNVLNYLASRAALFVSQNTKPLLDNMSMVLERLDDDLSVDRQVIADSVNFYVSVVSYRMNTSIKAMTAVNIIFVPLTLLAAIYGMNFRAMPELQWRYGYPFFWILFVVTLLLSLLWLKKRG